MSGRRRAAASLAPLVALAACAAPPVGDIAPGERPAALSDEAGTWIEYDDEENALRSSARLVKDAALNEYLREVACRLSPAYCPDLRLYVVDLPEFNATMSPNGMLQVWTGLLLRVHNEAQLATVLGHEMAHYQKRHGVKRMRDRERRGDLQAILRVGVQDGGSAAVLAADLVLLAGMFQYSRDQEREADRIGVELVARAGYDPAEASKVWVGVSEELDVGGESWSPYDPFSTHPHYDERATKLDALAARLRTGGDVRSQAFLERVRPLRGKLLEDELRQRRFARSQLILERLLASGDAPGEVHFYLGELYRERGDAGDEQQALDQYRLAAEGAGAPPETWRSLGWIHRRRGEGEAARRAYARYLELRPDAPDRAMVESWLAEAP